MVYSKFRYFLVFSGKFRKIQTGKDWTKINEFEICVFKKKKFDFKKFIVGIVSPRASDWYQYRILFLYFNFGALHFLVKPLFFGPYYAKNQKNFLAPMLKLDTNQ